MAVLGFSVLQLKKDAYSFDQLSSCMVNKSFPPRVLVARYPHCRYRSDLQHIALLCQICLLGIMLQTFMDAPEA